jgi:hypothetical protein
MITLDDSILKEFDEKLKNESDPNRKMAIVNEAIKYTDQFPMSLDDSISQTEYQSDIQRVACARSDFLLIKMKLLEGKVYQLNQEGAKAADKKEHDECDRLFQEANLKCIESIKKYD